MPRNIGLSYVNIPYGMPQLQHYSSGQQISNHTSMSNVIDQVYAAFSYGDYKQQMQSLPEQKHSLAIL